MVNILENNDATIKEVAYKGKTAVAGTAGNTPKNMANKLTRLLKQAMQIQKIKQTKLIPQKIMELLFINNKMKNLTLIFFFVSTATFAQGRATTELKFEDAETAFKMVIRS